MARELDEKNLIICVRADVAPLAKAQFPQADIIPLPLRTKRRLVNLAAVNVFHCLPIWLKLIGFRVDAAVCLRSMRAYLHTITFYLPRTTRRIACENLLLSNPRLRRPAVENFVNRTFRPILLPYPEKNILPSDIEANRLVTSKLLNRDLSPEECLPRLTPPHPVILNNRWLLCPFSSSRSKDYPAESWTEVLKILDSDRAGAPLQLAAAPDQSDRLHDFARILKANGLRNFQIDPPVPLPAFIQSIAEARLVLTVDTSAAHMACAIGTPAVIISAGQHPGVYAPYSRNGVQKWLVPPEGISGKEWRTHFSPGSIVEAIREILNISSR